jgi:hypothetical protein
MEVDMNITKDKLIKFLEEIKDHVNTISTNTPSELAIIEAKINTLIDLIED